MVKWTYTTCAAFLAALSTDVEPVNGGHPTNLPEFQDWRHNRPSGFPSNPQRKFFDEWFCKDPWKTFCGEGQKGGFVSAASFASAAFEAPPVAQQSAAGASFPQPAADAAFSQPAAGAAFPQPAAAAQRRAAEGTLVSYTAEKTDQFFSGNDPLLRQGPYMQEYDAERRVSSEPVPQSPAKTRSAAGSTAAAAANATSPPPRATETMDNGTTVATSLTPKGSMQIMLRVPPNVVEHQGLREIAAVSPIHAVQACVFETPSLLNIAIGCGLSGNELIPYQNFNDSTFGVRKSDAAALGDRSSGTVSALIAPLLAKVSAPPHSSRSPPLVPTLSYTF